MSIRASMKKSGFGNFFSDLVGQKSDWKNAIDIVKIKKHFEEHQRLIIKSKNALEEEKAKLEIKEENLIILKKLQEILAQNIGGNAGSAVAFQYNEAIINKEQAEFDIAKRKLEGLQKSQFQRDKEEKDKKLEINNLLVLKREDELKRREQQLLIQQKREQESLLLKRSQEDKKKKEEEKRLNQQIERENLERKRHALHQYFQASVKDGFSFYCCYPYLPTRYIADSYHQQIRRKVYDFKDGKNSAAVAEDISKKLLLTYSTEELRSSIFVVIPASTHSKNILRFKTFCSIISKKTGLYNGFDCITIKEDRQALKGSSNINKVYNLNYNQRLIDGKPIILFDDVMTSGSSFIQNAKILKGLGAKEITGIFLAKTVNH
jgi:predicted amidophosphoribosyltransferase